MGHRTKSTLPLLVAATLLLGAATAAAAEGPPDLAAETQALWQSASPQPAQRIQACLTLAASGSDPAVHRLVALAYGDPEPEVRRAAIEGIAAIRDPRGADVLRAIAARDPRPELRQLAGERATQLDAFRKRPGMAAGLGLLCPGCGYFYLRRPGRGLAYLGSTLGLVVAAGVALAGEELRLSGIGPRQEPSTAPLALPLAVAAANLWGYGIFAAYRDARLARGDLASGYEYPVSPEGLGDLVSAPFRPRVLARPWFWAGLPVMLGAAVGVSALMDRQELGRNTRTLGDGGGVWFLGRRHGKASGILLGESYYASLFLPVAVGEEAVFRGVLQPALSEGMGLWPGWVATSLVFGALHVFNFTEGTDADLKDAAVAVPFITGVGSYLGLAAIKTGFRLETSVALHFWYDFLLGTISFIADPDHQPFAVRIGLPF